MKNIELMRNRFLTFNTVIRVNQIEVTREQNEGVDECNRHTPEKVKAFREAFAKGWPDGKITWSFSWRALHDNRDNYKKIRELIAEYHEKYGDDVTFIPGGYFANAYNNRKQVNLDLHEGIAKITEMIGGDFRPQSIIAGFLSAENLRYLAEQEGIHVCQGNIWSQYAIDNQDGDGSIVYPYYPSKEHFCKPAQNSYDFIDCVNLDGWTVDFLAARRAGQKDGFRSRMGVGPIETIGTYGPEIGLKQMMETTSTHFDIGFKLNNWAWVTNNWEISLVDQIGHLDYLTKWLKNIRIQWPDTKCITLGDFGLIWRQYFKNNDNIDYKFIQKGSGIGGSDKNLRIRWFMNHRFRLALIKDCQKDEKEMVIDFTRYDLPAQEPKGMTRNWSLLGKINQKQIREQDKPILIENLTVEDQTVIYDKYPELKKN